MRFEVTFKLGQTRGRGGMVKGNFIFWEMGGIRCMGKDKDAALHNGVM